MRRKGNQTFFLGWFFHADFGKQEESWVLEKRTIHVVVERNHERVDFCARRKFVCLYLIFLVEEMAQEP
jgi:hypothetical protein